MSAELIDNMKQDEIKKASAVVSNKILSKTTTGNQQDTEHAVGMITSQEGSDIRKFFAGTHVLITGGTGFLGKILIEKLLRTCPEIVRIYLIIRVKKGKDQSSRLKEIFEDIVFSKLRSEYPNFEEKVIPISGDFAVEGLGLSEEDRQTIIDNVSIIIHGAATVRFDEHLSIATAINVRGTHDILALAKCCRLLKVFTHISTAFTNCNVYNAQEKFYEPPTDYKTIMALASMDHNIVQEITPKIIGKFPNTYTYTKSIAEDIVKQFSKNIPVCVVRPSIVVSTYEEPIRGWTDNLYGPTGVVLGCSTGILRTMHADPECRAEIVPVDLTVNCILAATWDTAVRFKENFTSDPPIYHFASGEQLPITWRTFIDLNLKYGIETPPIKAIWYYGFTPQKYRSLYLLYALFLQVIPAIIADTVLTVIGKERIMMKMNRKIAKFSSLLAFFTTRNFLFSMTSTTKLWSRMNHVDKSLFYFDLTKMSWDYHSEKHFLGLRVYLAKDDVSTIPEAIIKFRRLYYLHLLVKAVFYFFIVVTLWKGFVNLFLLF